MESINYKSNRYKYESSEDYVWVDSLETPIILNGTTATVTLESVSVDGSTVTIGAAGYYLISGSLTNGQIVIAADSGIVRLKFDGVSLYNSSTSPFYVKKSKKTIVSLAENSENIISDASNYSSSEEPNAALFSNSYLAITGTGNLVVKGNSYDRIASDDELIINEGTITVTAKDDGLRGKIM